MYAIYRCDLPELRRVQGSFAIPCAPQTSRSSLHDLYRPMGRSQTEQQRWKREGSRTASQRKGCVPVLRKEKHYADYLSCR